MDYLPPTPSGCWAPGHWPLLTGQLPSSRPSSTADLSRRGREPEGRSSLGPRGDGEQEVSILQRSNSPKSQPTRPATPGGASPRGGEEQSRGRPPHIRAPAPEVHAGRAPLLLGTPPPGPAIPSGAGPGLHAARVPLRSATWRGFPGCLEQLPGSRLQPSAPQLSSGLAHCGLGRATPPPDGHYLGRNS